VNEARRKNYDDMMMRSRDAAFNENNEVDDDEGGDEEELERREFASLLLALASKPLPFKWLQFSFVAVLNFCSLDSLEM
jgi:hypothetical protein